MSDTADFTELDDSALLSRRAEMRAELQRIPPASPEHAALTALYDKSTEEVNDRARKAWSTAKWGAGPMNEGIAGISAMPADAMRMMAVEILLADPEALGDDVLESCLYVLREKLRAG